MNILTRLSTVGESLRKILEDEGRLEEVSNRWAKTAGRVAAQFVNVVEQAQAELAARIRATRQPEQASQALEATTQMATEYGPAEGQIRRPAAQAKAPTNHRVKATSADIRAWAREHNMTVGDRGTIPKRIIDAYGRAHAS